MSNQPRRPGQLSRPNRGLTLLESMITTLLFALVLAMVAAMVSSYRRHSVLSAQKDNTITVAMTTLSMLRKEALAAYEVITPVPGSSGHADRFEFRRLDPNADRLGDPGAPPASWDPIAAGDSALVTYEVGEAERLIRDAVIDGQSTSVPVAEGVSDFRAEFLASGNLQLTLTVQTDTRQTILKTQVFRGHRDET